MKPELAWSSFSCFGFSTAVFAGVLHQTLLPTCVTGMGWDPEPHTCQGNSLAGMASPAISLFCPRVLQVAQAGLDLVCFLPQPSGHLDDGPEPLDPAHRLLSKACILVLEQFLT